VRRSERFAIFPGEKIPGHQQARDEHEDIHGDAARGYQPGNETGDDGRMKDEHPHRHRAAERIDMRLITVFCSLPQR
jgi:hypothetical protein